MDNLLLEIGGKELYLDIDRLSEIVRIESEDLIWVVYILTLQNTKCIVK
jgi:hypothetical protein